MTKKEHIKCRACGEAMYAAWWDNLCDKCGNKIEDAKQFGQCISSLDAEQECPCKKCDRQREDERKKQLIEKLNKELDSRLNDKTPRLFGLTDIKHPEFNTKAYEKAMEWEYSSDKPWLGLTGVTGTCKSRISFLVAHDRLKTWTNVNLGKFTFEFVDGYQITEAVMAQYSDRDYCASSRTPWDDPREWLYRLRNVDLLVINDLGKSLRGTNSRGQDSAVTSELFALIDTRHQKQMPLIWTSNSLPDQMCADMSDDTGPALAGRLNEASSIYMLSPQNPN